MYFIDCFFFFSSRRRHTRSLCDWSSDVCSSDLPQNDKRKVTMSETRNIAVTVNGKRYERSVDVRLTLADFLRGPLGLTGTHLGCERGVCGACPILVDGQPPRPCLMLAGQRNRHQL